MKSVKSYSTLLTGLLLVTCFGATATTALAGHGGETGGGGDMCENRIQTIGDDIASWIQKGGSRGLKLPASMSVSQYNSAMLDAISQAKVSCTDEVITIGHAEKTCKNYFDDGTPRILCNTKRFQNTDESSQYVLVHHEFAGLAQIEVADGEHSVYDVSNQISKFLVNQVLKKLAVMPSANRPAEMQALIRDLVLPNDELFGHNSCGRCRITLSPDEVSGYTFLEFPENRDATNMFTGCAHTEIKLPRKITQKNISHFSFSESQTHGKLKYAYTEDYGGRTGVCDTTDKDRKTVDGKCLKSDSVEIDYDILRDSEGSKNYRIRAVKTSSRDDMVLMEGGFVDKVGATQNCIIDRTK
jgi:hypothetical protein